MRKDREQAIVLRKSGMSYSDIMARMAVPKSTLSDWFKDQKWSNDIAIECAKRARNGSAMRFMVLNTVRGNRLRKVYEDAKQDAFVDFEELKYHPLFIVGVMTYWAHGDKTSKHRVSVTSGDFKVISIFRMFLENICSQKSTRARIFMNRTDNHEEVIRYWVEKSGLKYEQFYKIAVVISPRIVDSSNLDQFSFKKSNNSDKLVANNGICNIGLSSAYLKSKILKWIELMVIEIGEERYLQNNAGIV